MNNQPPTQPDLTHGQLIRSLRKERSITQAQITQNISHRTTLISFEKYGTHIDHATLLNT
ncbi:hypothetical protein [Lapidilactobacillus bayanensis]|uniref:hypothetical protein n=1 Tax=Lapidilactobacillus bayanensis TaxID=2485998 RepID=UPI000F78B257|nr:hypothetical protein [Lapidilactobacillus bayanensis]